MSMYVLLGKSRAEYRRSRETVLATESIGKLPSPVERRAVSYYHFNVKQCGHNAEVYRVESKITSAHVQGNHTLS